uniref:Uncharacterized protein n=1 Tax=Anguilla anguilla TaxID=7936 RepID=A0A0E9TJL1_ANGAN
MSLIWSSGSNEKHLYALGYLRVQVIKSNRGF